MSRFIAMIPARLGSKRIPKKNIRYMLDKPLIQYPIEFAIESGRFEEVWVNTEDDELGKIVEEYGAQFHKRPSELATDTATNRDFTYEFLLHHDCDYVIMMNTTSPLLRQNTINGFLDYVDENNYDTVLSVVAQKEETFYKNEPLNFSFAEKVNSQLLEPTESVVWSLTAWKRSTFIELQEKGINPVFGGLVGKYAIPKDESCDLDTEEDWNIAEGILTSRLNKKDARYLDIGRLF